MTILLEASQIHRDFQSGGNRSTIIEDLSLRLYDGEIVSLVGASGCGKTTFLRILAGLDTNYEGKILSSVTRPGPQVGYLQQGDRLLPWRSLIQNVSLTLELQGNRNGRFIERSKEELQYVDLSEYADYFPHEISGGMTQRTLFARLLVGEPKLLLLDEPLGQLDMVGRRTLATRLREYVKRSGAGAIIVTHSVEEAVFISDRVLVVSLKPCVLKHEFIVSDNDEARGNGTISRKEGYGTVLSALVSVIEAGGKL